jgi:hypothetical protein
MMPYDFSMRDTSTPWVNVTFTLHDNVVSKCKKKKCLLVLCSTRTSCHAYTEALGMSHKQFIYMNIFLPLSSSNLLGELVQWFRTLTFQGWQP